MLSLAGASYQGVFRNPLVDPYLLGAAAGAGLGATIVFTVGRGVDRRLARRPGAGGGVRRRAGDRAVTYVVGAAFGGTRSSVTLVLAGVAVVSLATAIQTFLLQRNSEVVREVYTWILGRLSSAPWADVRLVAAVRRRQLDRAAAAPPAPRPAPGRRRRGGDARRAGRPRPARRRGRGDARHRRRRGRQRADRLRRHRRAAHRAPARRRQLPAAAAAVGRCSAPRS